MRSSGITTSSLILNAFVCRAIAAVRERSSQNFLRASALTATKPSPERRWRAHDFGSRARDRILVVADDVAEQHHLRQRAALGLGRVADRAQIALVEVFQARELRAVGAGARVEEALDLDDRRNRVARVTEEFEAHGADVLRHPVQHPARRGDHAVAAFLLHAGQAAEKLVGDVLAEPGLAELAAFDLDALGAQDASRSPALRVRPSRSARSSRLRFRGSCRGCARGARPRASCRSGSTMRHQARLSTAVPHNTAFLPPAFIATLPPMQDASAEVGSTANTSPARSAASDTRRVTTPASVKIVGTGPATPAQRALLDAAERFEFFGVDHRRERRERNRAAGVARAAAARNDRQPELDARAHQRRNLRPRRPGASTTNGYSTRQSVASVTCDTRANASKRMLSARVWRSSKRRARLRNCTVRAKSAANPSTALARRLEQLADLGVARHVRRVRAAVAPRSSGDAAPRSAAAAAADCRSGRPAGTDCAARPRCRPALRTACAPSGRCGAPRAARPGCATPAPRAGARRSRDRRRTCSCMGSRADA